MLYSVLRCDVTPDGRRVLQVLLRANRRSPEESLRLRKIAIGVLGGDSERAARALAELDAEGYVRTETMGWLSGRVTEKARQHDTEGE
jgi:hypothetical protein